MFRNCRFFLRAVFVCVIGTRLVSSQSLGDEGANALRFYAAQNEANREKILSFCGDGRITTLQRTESTTVVTQNSQDITQVQSNDIKGPFLKGFESSVDFKLDLRGNKFKTNWLSIRAPYHLNPESLEPVAIDGYSGMGMSIECISIPGEFIARDPSQRPPDGISTTNNANPNVFKRTERSHGNPEEWDPRIMFRLTDKVKFHTLFVNQFADYIDGGNYVSNLEKGTVHVVRISTKVGDDFLIELEFDPSQDFMLTGYSGFDRSEGVESRQVVRFSYEKHKGIWVPVKRHFSFHRNNELRHSNDVMLDSVTVNEGIDDSDFEFSALSPKNGDVVLDELENEVKLIRNGVAVSQSEYLRGLKSTFWVRFTGGTVLILLVTSLCWTKLRRGKAK